MLLENDQHSKDVIKKMLNDLGYSSIITASNVEKAEYHFKQKLNQIRLIVASDKFGGSIDFSVSRLIHQKGLELVPLILLTDEFRSQYASYRTSASRVDSVISRPFAINQLKEGLSYAHRRRAEYRNSLLIVGKEKAEIITEEIYSRERDYHWKKASMADSFAKIKLKKEELGSYLGAILVQPEYSTPELIEWLTQFKRTYQGAGTPIVFLGHDSYQMGAFRSLAECFWDKTDDLDELLNALSRRVRFGWEISEKISVIRGLIREDKIKEAGREIESGLKLDPTRWELLELGTALACKMKDIEAARKYFLSAHRTQPCSPFSYLVFTSFLADLNATEERQKWVDCALRYCPHHPQIRALSPRSESHVSSG